MVLLNILYDFTLIDKMLVLKILGVPSGFLHKDKQNESNMNSTRKVNK